MTRARAMALFVGVFLLALVLTFPLGLALRWAGADAAGLSARATSGDIWTGRLEAARYGALPVGTAIVGLKPLPLLVGTTELGADTEIGYGYAQTGGATRGLRKVTAKLPLAAALAPLPVETLELTEATILFRGIACSQAEGRVRATFVGATGGNGSLGGLNLSQGMTGIARCEGDAVVLPLVSQTGLERLTVRWRVNGQWTALLSVKAGDPALTDKLRATGFTNAGDAMVLRLSGG